jgi:Uma2 family endonuclease
MITSTPMPEPARRCFSFRDYVRLEEYSNVRHEFLDGVIYAMAGGTPAHAALAGRLIQRLGPQLQGTSSEVFTSDLRVRVSATGLTTYPDVTIVCGRLETDP